MKRIKAACIIQTLHFFVKDGVGAEYERKYVQEEVEKYKKGLDKNLVKYRILSEEEQADGSVILEIRKQYNAAPVGSYLDQ